MGVTAAPLAKPKSSAQKKAPKKARPVIQPKLDVGPVGDHFEREADSVARRVMSGGEAPIAIPPTITPLTAQRGTKPGSADGGQGGAAPASVESSIARLQSGSASPLDGGTRHFMENRFGRDFSDVRVHRGGDAQTAAQSLGAKAFTVGNDLFFNRGQYRPDSNSGRTLIAHELTHTVQQAGINGFAARKLIQRNGDGDPPGPNEDGEFVLTQADDQLDARINLTSKTIYLPILRLPALYDSIKGARTDRVSPKAGEDQSRTLPAVGENVNFTQRPVPQRPNRVAKDTWTTFAREEYADEIGATLRAKDKAGAVTFGSGSDKSYALGFDTGTQTANRYMFVGTYDELSQSDLLLRPQWSPAFSPQPLDADHIMEYQIGGADEGENLWLLHEQYNRRIGPAINQMVDPDISAAKTKFDGKYGDQVAGLPESPKSVRLGWTIVYKEVAEHSFGISPNTTNVFWTKADIEAGRHLERIKFLTPEDMAARGFNLEADNGNPSYINVFPVSGGGEIIRMDVAGTDLTIPAGGRRPDTASYNGLVSGLWFYGGRYTGPEGNILAEIDVGVYQRRVENADGDRAVEEQRGSINILRHPVLPITGYIDPEGVYDLAHETDFRGLSPLTFSSLAITSDAVLVGIGNILSSKAIFPNLNVPLTLAGDQIRMDFPLPMDAISLGPVTVTEVAMGLGVGANGLFVDGTAAFIVSGLGSGSVTAELSQDGGPRLSGRFDIDADFFSESSIEVTYDIATDQLTASGILAVESGRIPGVESGTVTVTITRDNIDVRGTINLAGPLAGSTIEVGYTQEEGLTIGGTFPLPLSNLPAVQNATMTLNAARDPDSGAWSLSGTGTANLAVPGASGRIELAYADGLVTMTANAEIARGPASGTLNFTATNGAIDEEGNPVEGEIGDDITAWGRGSVTIRFGNILQGTAGIEYTADNRVILSGGIALPPVYEVFARREFNRDLLHLEPPEFPIWGVSVAGVGVGIFAFVDARISFSSYVGPGEIRDAEITAEMDLDRPQDATIHGGGQFFVPAYAGLNLDVGGGLRARATVAYAEGRVGLEGRLGIEADASASVDIDWNRTDGLEIQADFEANARPKFQLLANASLTVGVDLLVTEASHTFGPWERNLGEFGPDMEMGVDFPVRWSEADGLDLSLDNMTIREPTLDASGLMGDVFDRLVA